MSDITLENLSYYHAKGTPYEIKALDDIALNIKEGRITGIIGHTGSGKSTLVQMFNGILKPHSGRVLLSGEDIWKKPKKIRNVRFKVGLVMQYPEYQLFEETVYKDIAFGPKNMGLSEDEIKKRVLNAISYVGLTEAYLEKSPFDLSGGEKRRVAIAGVIAMEPKVLILDEPTAGLDPMGKNALLKLIKDYNEQTGSTVIFVSHNMDDVAVVADRVIVMNKGQVALSGTVEEVYSKGEILSDLGLDVPEITNIFLELKKNSFFSTINRICSIA